jgi:hypothetical protein
MEGSTPQRESGVLTLKEDDEVRANDGAVLAPEGIRGKVGTIPKIDRFPTPPPLSALQPQD